MKKLMTMIAAVAMSFGLYATEEFKAGTCFNSWTDISDRTGDENLTWSVSLCESTLLDPAGWSGLTVPTRWFEADAGKALNIKTALGTEFVTCAPTETIVLGQDEKIYVDTLVKFTAFDEDAQFTDANAKLAVWIMETTNTTGDVAGTNLFITAGAIDAQGTITKTSYDCGPYTAGEWCRLTIKSMGSLNGTGTGAYGFVVYVNGKPVVCTEEKGLNNITLSTLAQYYADANILFPSLVNGTEISSLAISGQGAIDDIAFTTEAPSFAQDMDYVTVDWTGVTSDIGEITLTTNNNTQIDLDQGAKSKVIYYTGDAPAVTFEWAGTETVLAGSKTLQSGDDTLTIAEGDLQKAIVEFDGTKYATMSAAIDAAYTATGTDNTIKILAASVDGFTFSNVTENAVVTLDLNGKTVMGTEGYDAAIYVDSGKLVITDSIGTGIVNGTACKGATGQKAAKAVDIEDGASVFIQAGTFIGAAYGPATGTFTGGTFDVDPSENDDVAEGYKVIEEGGKYKIVKIVYVTAKFYVDSVLVDTQKIESGTEPTNVVVTKTGYTFKNWDPAIGAITADTDYNAVFALNVAEINGTPFTSLQEAFAVVGDNETIELINDIEATAEIDLERGTAANYTINLAGHTITNYASNGYVLWFKSQQTVKITDTVGNGKIERWTNNGTMIRVGYWGATTNYPAANAVALTLDGATVAGKIKDNAAFKVENGSFTMESGSIDVDTSVSGVAISVRGANTAAINGGTLIRGAFEFGTGAVQSQLTIDADVVATAETQFSVDPTAYLDDDGYEGKQDETSGLWTVVEKQSEPVIDPTKPSEPMAEGAAEALVAAINADKSKIGIPEDFTGMDDTAKETYQSYFDAVKVPVEGGDQFKVELQLNADGVEAVSNAVVTAETAILAANVATADATVSIENPIPGFYYGLRQGASLTGDVMKITEVEISIGAAIEFDAKHYENAGFYQMLVSPKELTVEVDPE